MLPLHSRRLWWLFAFLCSLISANQFNKRGLIWVCTSELGFWKKGLSYRSKSYFRKSFKIWRGPIIELGMPCSWILFTSYPMQTQQAIVLVILAVLMTPIRMAILHGMLTADLRLSVLQLWAFLILIICKSCSFAGLDGCISFWACFPVTGLWKEVMCIEASLINFWSNPEGRNFLANKAVDIPASSWGPLPKPLAVDAPVQTHLVCNLHGAIVKEKGRTFNPARVSICKNMRLKLHLILLGSG